MGLFELTVFVRAFYCLLTAFPKAETRSQQ